MKPHGKYRAPLRLGVVMLFILETLRRMFRESKPIDLVLLAIELLVLLLIGYEVGHDFLRRWKIKHRTKACFLRMSAGQQLQQNAPRQDAKGEDIDAWIQSTTSWIKETRDFLKPYSLQAAASFMHSPGGMRFQYDHIPAQVNSWYETLIERISNLRAIIENPDVYF